jgi:integrase
MPQPAKSLIPLKQGGNYVRTKDGSRKRWAVYLPPGSKPRRRFFRTEAEAAKFCERERAVLGELGLAGLKFTEENRREAAACLRKLSLYTVPGGKPATLSAAVDYFIREAELRLASLRVKDAVEEYTARLVRRGRSLRYIEQARSALRGFCEAFGEEPLTALRRGKIQGWLDARKAAREHSLTTQKNLLGYARGLLSWCVKDGLLTDNPAQGVETAGRPEPKKDRLLKPEEFNLMLANCPPSLRPTVALLGLTGVRAAEAARLKWEDISEGCLYIDADIAKTKTDRAVPLTPALLRYLAKVKPADPSAYIFPAAVYARDAAKAADPQLLDLARGRTLLKHLGRLKKFLSPYVKFEQNTLRTSFASYLLATGKTYEQVAAVAGHDSRITRKNYKQRRISAEDARKWFETNPAAPTEPELPGFKKKDEPPHLTFTF